MPAQKQGRGRSKRGKKRPRPPATDDYIKVVPLRIEDDIALPVQVSSYASYAQLAWGRLRGDAAHPPLLKKLPLWCRYNHLLHRHETLWLELRNSLLSLDHTLIAVPWHGVRNHA